MCQMINFRHTHTHSVRSLTKKNAIKSNSCHTSLWILSVPFFIFFFKCSLQCVFVLRRNAEIGCCSCCCKIAQIQWTVCLRMPHQVFIYPSVWYRPPPSLLLRLSLLHFNRFLYTHWFAEEQNIELKHFPQYPLIVCETKGKRKMLQRLGGRNFLFRPTLGNLLRTIFWVDRFSAVWFVRSIPFGSLCDFRHFSKSIKTRKSKHTANPKCPIPSTVVNGEALCICMSFNSNNHTMCELLGCWQAQIKVNFVWTWILEC